MNNFTRALKLLFITQRKRNDVIRKAQHLEYNLKKCFSVVSHSIDGNITKFYPIREGLGILPIYLFDEKKHTLTLYSKNGEVVAQEVHSFIDENNKKTFKGVDYYYVYTQNAIKGELGNFYSVIQQISEGNEKWYRNGTKLNPDYYNGTLDRLNEAAYLRALNPNSSMSHIDRWLILRDR